MRKDLGDFNRFQPENSALKEWLRTNGRDTIEKFNDFEKSNFKKELTFSGKNNW
jgi:hypothetical protein